MTSSGESHSEEARPELAELYRRAHEDAARMGRLLSVTASFSWSTTPEEIAGVLVTQGQEALHADAAMVMLLDDRGENLKLAASHGYPPEVAKKWSALPLEPPTPLADAIRLRTPLFFESPAEVVRSYPSLGGERYHEDQALAAIPLLVDERAYGALALVFRRARPFADDDKAFIVLLAAHCAQAIDRARLLVAETRARGEAEAANRMKDEFLATMSHELRTPLNAVLGWATTLQGGDLDPALVRRGIEVIARNAKAQARLVEDVLDVARIASGKLDLDAKRIDVGRAVTGAVDGLRAAAKSKEIDLVLTLGKVPDVLADGGRLEQVVWNLVSNAVKFTPTGGRVVVSTRSRASKVLIEVTDNGAGLSEDFLPHVFERFRQADGSTTRRFGGLGLGLAIVRHLVELHGGTVSAMSDGEGKGATFTVVLPSLPTGTQALAEGAPTVPTNAQPLLGLRVLVVEDNRDAREIVAMMLGQQGAGVVSVEGAKDALARFALLRPDVVVCDVGMPEMDGYSFIREVRRLPPSKGGNTPAIALSGFARKEDADRALAAGFDAHVAKPVDVRTLTGAVAELSGRRPSGGA